MSDPGLVHGGPGEGDLASLALGLLTGRERAETLAHVESCPRCSAELEHLSRAADALLEVVPEGEPPIGFEVRALDRLGVRAHRRRRLGPARLALAIGAVAAVVGLGFGIGRLTEPGGASGPGSAISSPLSESRIAPLVVSGHSRGTVLIYPGRPGWMLMAVNGMSGSGDVTCVVTTNDGRTVTVGTYWISHGNGAWASVLPVAVKSVRSAALVTSSGSRVAIATFPSA